MCLAPYWDAILTPDTERKQDKKEAEETGKGMAETYARLGHRILSVPRVRVEQRADFMADNLLMI